MKVENWLVWGYVQVNESSKVYLCGMYIQGLPCRIVDSKLSQHAFGPE